MIATLEQYQNYTFILGNRHTNNTFVNRLRRQLEANEGIVPETVEWIITVNSRGQIVDGQCHWQAIMNYNTKNPKHQIPSIIIIMEPDAGLDRAREINNTRTGWKEKDYFDSYIDLGNEDYVTLRRIRQSQAGKTCGLTIVLRVCGYLEDKDALSKFRKGEFEMIREEPNAVEMLCHIAACKKALGEDIGDRNIAPIVFAKCLLIPGINKTHLVDRISHPELTARGFRYSTNELDILRNISVLYNRNLPESVRRLDIYSMYRDVQEHNWRNMRSATQLPNLRILDTPVLPARIITSPTPPTSPTGASALRIPDTEMELPTKQRRRSLKDDGVVPV